MNVGYYEKLVWFYNQLAHYRLTRRELSEKCCSQFSMQKLSRQTLNNWITDLEGYFSVKVSREYVGRECTYGIEDNRPSETNISTWMRNAMAVKNMLHENIAISNRIVLEHIPSGEVYLEEIMFAIRNNLTITFTYSDYWEDTINVRMNPYFVQLFKQHWKVVGPAVDENNNEIEDSIRSYALDSDRMEDLQVTENQFIYPEDFNPKTFFNDVIGTTNVSPRILPPVRIEMLVWEKYNFYFKNIPFHNSQNLEYDCPEDGYSIFSYYLQPTDDFYRELCRYGNYIEVLSPIEVRNNVKEIIKGMQDEYEGKSRASCKKSIPDKFLPH